MKDIPTINDIATRMRKHRFPNMQYDVLSNIIYSCAEEAHNILMEYKRPIDRSVVVLKRKLPDEISKNCPSCGAIIEYPAHNYCPGCASKIHWI